MAGVKLAADGDEVIAALPVSCANGEAILSVSEKGWKVTEVADIPVKGRGGAGVGFHPLVNGETALVSRDDLGDRASCAVSGRCVPRSGPRPRSRAPVRMCTPAEQP